MEIYSAFNIKVNNANREAVRFPYFWCVSFLHHYCMEQHVSPLTFLLTLEGRTYLPFEMLKGEQIELSADLLGYLKAFLEHKYGVIV